MEWDATKFQLVGEGGLLDNFKTCPEPVEGDPLPRNLWTSTPTTRTPKVGL
jgi:hypothetical protein